MLEPVSCRTGQQDHHLPCHPSLIHLNKQNQDLLHYQSPPHVYLIWQNTFSQYGGSLGKESAYNAGDPSSIPGWGRSSGEGNVYPLQYAYLGNPMDRGAWQATYSPWGHKELDTTEQRNHHHGIHGVCGIHCFASPKCWRVMRHSKSN